jgi:hypothetical protein
MKINPFLVGGVIITFVVIVATVGVMFWFQPLVDFSGAPINSTGEARTPIAAQSIPTVINGIIAATSVIIGFSGAIIGILFRDIFKEDPKGRAFLFLMIFMFAIALVYPWSTYIYLGIGLFVLAMKWALSGFILSLYLFMLLLLFSLNELTKQFSKKSDEAKPKPDQRETNPDEKKTEEKSKNVNVSANTTHRQISKWLRKWRFYVVAFLIGIVGFPFVGGLFYMWANPSMYSYDPRYQGFAVDQNSTVIPNGFYIDFNANVNPPELFFQYWFIIQTNGTYSFIFSFPFNVFVVFHNADNMTINPTSTDTVMYVTLPENEGSQDIWGDFGITRTFLSDNRGFHTIELPFGGVVNSDAVVLEQKLGIEPSFQSVSVNLYVGLPISYSYVESIPAISDSNPFVNPQTNVSSASLHWYFNNGLQNSVTIVYNDQSEVGYLQNMTFWSGIFFALGFSLAVNTMYDAYRKRVENSPSRPS